MAIYSEFTIKKCDFPYFLYVYQRVDTIVDGFVNQQASLGGTILGSRNATKAWNDANWIGEIIPEWPRYCNPVLETLDFSQIYPVDSHGIVDLADNAFAGEITSEETFTIQDLLITSIDNGQGGVGHVKVMRNPTSGRFRVVLSDRYLGKVKVNVISAAGTILQSVEEEHYLSGAELEIDLRNQPDGLYLLNVSNANYRDVVKLLKRSD